MKTVPTLVVLFAAAVAGRASAQTRPDSADPPATIARLAGLARVWGFAKYFHPALAYRTDIDWDAALVAAIPRVRQARNAREYGAAVEAMLGRLDDPLTRVTHEAPAPKDPPANPPFGYRTTPGQVLVITAGDYYAFFDPSVQQKLGEMRAALPGARAVVLDLRSRSPVDSYGRLQLSGTLADLERQLTGDTLVTPGERRRVYYGYEGTSAFSSGQYRTGFMVEHGTRVIPASGARNIPVVYLLNEHAGILTAATTMQAEGRALIVFEGDIRRHSVGDAGVVRLADGLSAQVRESEPVFPDGTSGELRPDVVVAPQPGDGADAALDRAIALAQRFTPPRTARRLLPAAVPAAAERSYPSMRIPPIEYRLLAAFRAWNVIEHFHPYKALMDRPWEAALPEFIATMERASTERDYALAVAGMAARLQDAHAYVAGKPIDDYVIPPGYPPIRVRLVEDTPIVTFLYDSAGAAAAGIEVGDEVVSVDGQPARARLDQVARLISASTVQSGMDKATLTFMNGPIGSRVELSLRDRSGRVKRATLARRREDVYTLYHRERRGEVVRVLPGNVGYVDLDRLELDQVDSMFLRLASTRAIIFDMRGYPNSTIWAIAPRLTDSARVVALIATPMAGHRSPAAAAETIAQVVEPDTSGAPRYRGRIVMLTDERTMSQAEHTGLYLKAVRGATFVGGPTAGANGEITSMVLPGGITMGFTGQAVRWPDGRQLQRIGLAPDVPARPTIAGIRAGRDEVLEAALGVLTNLP